MAEKKIYQALESFYVGGQLINRGDTIVAGHPLLKGRTKLFGVFAPTFDEDSAKSEPEPAPTPEPDEEPQA